MSIDATLKERGSKYGEFKVQAITAQSLKNVMRNAQNWRGLDDYQREALDLITTKISRALHGDPSYADTWHDIAGYATLVEKELSK